MKLVVPATLILVCAVASARLLPGGSSTLAASQGPPVQQQGQQGPPGFDDRRPGTQDQQALDNGVTELWHLEARILRPVIVRAPSDAVARKPPLLVILHGFGASPLGVAGIWSGLDEPKPVLIIPSAPYSVISGSDKKPTLGGSWDLQTKDEKLWERADPLVVQYILDAVRAMRARYQSRAVYLMGHSQGVAYAYRAALSDPDLVNGVIAMAGRLGEKSLAPEVFQAAAGKVRVFIAHGKRDPMVAPDESRHARDFLQAHGFSVTYREFDGGHEVNMDAVRAAQAWMAISARPPAR